MERQIFQSQSHFEGWRMEKKIHRCEAVTSRGELCKYMAMSGKQFCEVHIPQAEGLRCKGVTKRNKQCMCKPILNGRCLVHFRIAERVRSDVGKVNRELDEV